MLGEAAAQVFGFADVEVALGVAEEVDARGTGGVAWMIAKVRGGVRGEGAAPVGDADGEFRAQPACLT